MMMIMCNSSSGLLMHSPRCFDFSIQIRVLQQYKHKMDFQSVTYSQDYAHSFCKDDVAERR